MGPSLEMHSIYHYFPRDSPRDLSRILRYGQIDVPEAFTQKARRCWTDSFSINMLGPDQADRRVCRCGTRHANSTLLDTAVVCNANLQAPTDMCNFLQPTVAALRV